MLVKNPEEPTMQELVERFEAAYNAIDGFLRMKFHKDTSFPFSSLLEINWPDKRPQVKVELRAFGDLRNALVHSKVKAGKILAYPSAWSVQRIEQISAELMSSVVAIPLFQRNVLILQTTDSLSHVMALIRQNNYSQFPVYSEKVFKGLLTEKGITRWLANHLSAIFSTDVMETIKISALLASEEGGENFTFCNRNAPVDDLLIMFARKPLVEAALITENGKKQERLLGIATRWDILRYG